MASESAQRPFTLSAGPLLRVMLLHLEEADHVLLLNLHHIIADGWSMGVLIRELGALYTAFSSGKFLLPELPIQYGRFGSANGYRALSWQLNSPIGSSSWGVSLY